MNKEREEILNWYEKEGKALIRRYIKEKNEFIEEYYKAGYSVCQDNSGVYIISFNDKPVYIGESGELAYRMITHLYNLFNRKTEWGIQPSHIEEGKVHISISISERGILNKSERKECESNTIIVMRAILQWKNDKYYPFDKRKKDEKTGKWIKREEIELDWCIRSAIRKEVVQEALGL